MKNRYFMIALAVLMLVSVLSFAGCGKKAETPAPTAAPTEAPVETPTEAPTEAPTEPAPTEPAWVPGIARAGYTEALYALLNKGDEVVVNGKFAHYYIIASEPYDLLVDERFVRLESDDAFESYTRYARNKSPVYDNIYMNNEPIAILKTNTKLTVLEEKGNWVYVEWSEGKGYMRVEDTSKHYISTGGYSGGSSSGGGSTNDGTDVDIGSLLSATDVRGDIALLGDYYGPEMDSIFDAPCKGVVLADEVEAYIALFGFGEEMKVLEYDDEFCTIYLNAGLTARVRRPFVKMEGDTEEDTFVGYAKINGAVLFKEYQSRNEVKTLKRNNQVEVLYKLPGYTSGGDEIYVVSVDGEIMYMQVSNVSDKKVQVPAGGGYSGGSSSGSSSSGEVWTPAKK